jgi:AmmeMemoRadiSam system protein B
MILRKSCLPQGWYPRSAGGVTQFIEALGGLKRGEALAAVAPHAGWYYSGALAARAAAALNPAADTVAVIGGHLPAGAGPLAAFEDGVSTPLGDMELDAELRDAFTASLGASPDRYADNTVEVLLPLVRYFFPHAKLLWLRFGAGMESLRAGLELARIANGLGRKLAVLGSTDLTHYGPNYDFSPKGLGPPALQWVEKVNDAAFINAALSGNAEAILARAETDRSACSAGAVLGALGFAQVHGVSAPELLGYTTSAAGSSEGVPDSFVGYGAFSWSL